MEKSRIYDLIGHKHLRKWIEQIEKEGFISDKMENKTLEKINDLLGDKKVDLMKAYCTAVEDRMQELYYSVSIKILNYGVAIGMEIKQALNDNDEY